MALSNVLKRTLKIGGIALVTLIASAVAIPFFFKDKIMVKVKETINKDFILKKIRDCYCRSNENDKHNAADFKGTFYKIR